MVVSNLQNSKGNAVKNQFIVNTGNFIYFKSYDSVIAKKEISTGKVYLDEEFYNYSLTTKKYRNLFLQEDSKSVENKINAHIYTLTNLQGEV